MGRRVLRRIVVPLALVFVVVLVAVGSARLADGPIQFLPGGVLESGELVDFASVDWEALAERRDIEVEIVSTRSSRLLRFTVYDGRPYLSCGLACDGERVKRWAYSVDRDGRVVLRIDGRRMLARLERVAAGSAEYVAVRREQAEKFSSKRGLRAAAEARAHEGIFAAGKAVSAHATDGSRLYRVVARSD